MKFNSNIYRLPVAKALAGANAAIIYATGAIRCLVRPEFPKHFSDSQSKVCQFH